MLFCKRELAGKPLRSRGFSPSLSDTRSQQELALMMKIRRRIETAIGILSEQFAITRIKARDLRHFTSKLTRKLIAYNFYLKLRTES